MPAAAATLVAWASLACGTGGRCQGDAGPRAADTPAAHEASAWLFMPAYDFESALRTEPPGTAGLTPTERPVQLAARFFLPVEGRGVLTVSDASSEKPLGTWELVPDVAGHLEVLAKQPSELAWVTATQAGVVLALPPGKPGDRRRFLLQLRGPAPWRREVTVRTEVTTGCFTIGHTMVHQVDIANGILSLRFEDLKDAEGLEVSRDYCGAPAPEQTLGPGFTVSLESTAFQDLDPALGPTRRRYLFRSGSTSHLVTCADGGCHIQRGLHATVREEPAGGLVYRTINGNAFRFVRVPGETWPGRLRLVEVTGLAGLRTEYRYRDSRWGPRLAEVVQADAQGATRSLNVTWESDTASGPGRLGRVELLGIEGRIEKCVRYVTDMAGQLARVERFEGACDPNKAPLEVSSYQYAAQGLAAWSGSDGKPTRYEYVCSGAVAGEELARLAPSSPRVCRVTLPDGPTASYEYDLRPFSILVFGQPTRVFETRLVERDSTAGAAAKGPVTFYRMNAYGALVRKVVERQLGSEEVTSVLVDPLHLKASRTLAEDGTLTSQRFDANGSPTEERRYGLFDVLAPEDPAVERWAWDLATGHQTCHVSPEGEVQLSSYDSDGLDPRKGRPSGSGALLVTEELANLASASALASGQDCGELAAAVPRSPEDQLILYTYCGVRAGPCPPGARPGERIAMRKLIRGEMPADRARRPEASGEPEGGPR